MKLVKNVSLFLGLLFIIGTTFAFDGEVYCKAKKLKKLVEQSEVGSSVNTNSNSEVLISYADRGYMTATWYGKKFHGRKTSSGDIFDQNIPTAAHKTLPFGTLLRLTNTKTNKSVVVRVNDRPGFRSKKRIDISRGAARALDMEDSGKAKVRVEVIQSNTSKSYIVCNKS